MYLDFLNARSPLRLLEKGLHGGLGKGNLGLVLAANVLVTSSYGFMMYVFKVNSFAARTIRVEEGQKVIDSGPYALVRHPMYTGALLLYLGTPVALGSWWALLPVLVIPFMLALRIRNEESVLHRELEGYDDYMERTRWRLVPGLW